jgi:hypothetical protein
LSASLASRLRACHQLISAPITITFAITYSHSSRITGPPSTRSVGFTLASRA